MKTIKNIWENRYTVAQYTALIATALNVLGIVLFYKFGENSDVLMTIGTLTLLLGLGLTIFTYCLGGIMAAIKSALGIAKWGWLIVPFPYDLVTGAAAFVYALIALFLLPVIPVRKAAKEYQIRG